VNERLFEVHGRIAGFGESGELACRRDTKRLEVEL
jgi:hypothetical protein